MNAPTDCKLCPRLCESRKKVVNGNGSLDANIMIVGQFPNELDEKFELFTLRSWVGKKLKKKLMPLAGIKPEEVYYASVVRCRPPSNKTGTISLSRKEVQQCRDFLRISLETVCPKIIITLGPKALEWFFPDLKITDVHGQVLQWEDKIVIPMYNPTILLANQTPHMLKEVLKDWAGIKEIINGIDDSDYGCNDIRIPIGQVASLKKLGDYELVSGIKLAQLMKAANVTRFAFDFETTDPMFMKTFQSRRAMPIGYSVAWEEGKAYYVDCSKNLGQLMVIRQFLEHPDIEVIAHNAKFEWTVCKNVGINLVNYHDTMVIAYLLRYVRTGLKALTRDLLHLKQTTFKEVDWTDIVQVTQYGAADSDMTLRLFNLLYPQLEKENLLSVYYDIELPLIPRIARMEMKGILLDTSKFEHLEQELIKRLDVVDKEIFELYPYNINWRSVPQKSHALFGKNAFWEAESSTHRLTFKDWPKKCRENEEEIELPVIKLVQYWPPGLGLSKMFGTDTGIPVLRKLKALYETQGNPKPILDLLIERNTIARALSGEITKLPILIQEDGRVHSSFHTVGGHDESTAKDKEGTDTGRLSSSGPNLHNITNHGDTARPYVAEWGQIIREGIIAPDGWKVVKADVGQEEPRIGAFKAGDWALLDAITNGDMYKVAASLAFDKEISEINIDERQIGKRMFMGWLNRAGPKGLRQSAFWLTSAAARRVIKYFATRFYLFEEWAEYEVAMLHENGYVRTHFDRKVVFPEIWTDDLEVVRRAEMACIPGIIQGTAADIIKMIINKVEQPILNLGGHLILNVHDEIVAEVPNEMVENVIKIMSTMTTNILPIHLPVGISVAQSWGAAKEEMVY